MLSFLTGAGIIGLFALRPFVYKPASRTLSPKAASYFTAFWCLALVLPTLPFCWEYLFLDGKFILFTPYVLFPLSKGIPLYFFIRYWQSLNKDSTTAASFYGVIALGAAAIITALLFAAPITFKQLFIVSLIGALGVIFFLIGEGNKLSLANKKSFVLICIFAILNLICDTLSIRYTNWYCLFVFSFTGMMLCALVFSRKELKIKQFFSSWTTAGAGIIFALGEVLMTFSMQYFFSVVGAVLLIRVGQSLDIILAHHINKEGSLSLQYFLAIATVTLSYFFFY